MSESEKPAPVAVDRPVGRPVPEHWPATCPDCGGLGYTDAWTMDGEYNPTHCAACDSDRKMPSVADEPPALAGRP